MSTEIAREGVEGAVGATAPVATQIEQMEMDPSGEIVYPTGPKLWLTLGVLYVAYFLNGLDLAIVAVAVPSITNYFKSIEHIGWYSAAYGLASSSTRFLVIPAKHLILFGLVAFVTGSAICTFAQQSITLIIGRAICGIGISSVNSTSLQIVTALFPSDKRSLWISLMGTAQCIGLVGAPIIGGLLIDKFSWRACFGINLPLCPILVAFTAFAFVDPTTKPDYNLPIFEKIKRLDVLGTVMVIPSVACLLIALQWGGITYGWHDFRIITLFVVFAILTAVFVGVQIYLGEKATIPPRIAMKRTVLSGTWFGICTNGILATTEYYISIYWQGVRNETAAQSGLLGVGMLVGLITGGLIAGFATPKVGYFTPFMFATSILTPIASGLLTTINLDEEKAKVVVLLGFIGFAVGIGNIAPAQALSTTLAPDDIAIGSAIQGFGGGMGSALFICASAALFQNRLIDEIAIYAPAANATAISQAGLSDIRNVIGKNNLRAVLSGYDKAVTETLYIPLALAVLTVIASVAMPWASVKKKQN